MLRLLKMLVIPLVAASITSGVCSLRESGSEQNMRKLAKLTAGYYAASTGVAIALALLLTLVMQPGRGAAFDKINNFSSSSSTSSGGGKCSGGEVVAAASSQRNQTQTGTGGGAGEALLHVSHLVVPDNIAQAAVDTNVLGIITFSLLFGWALSSLSPSPPVNALIQGTHTLNQVVGKMITAALWVSPVGVGCLIASSILGACDLWATVSALGMWLATVLLGLALFAFIILPFFLFAFTRKSPLRVASHFGQALALAFGTSSSAASLPLAMTGAQEAGCDPAVVSFFLPLGIAINMNGTALYEATTALFIAQAHGIVLRPAEVVVVAVTASMAAVGAPAIPSAGLVTMLIVLQAVGLDRFSGDLAVVLAADWLLDRVRTSVNLLSDAFGCVAVDHLMKSNGSSGNGSVSNGPAYERVEMGIVRERGQQSINT